MIKQDGVLFDQLDNLVRSRLSGGGDGGSSEWDYYGRDEREDLIREGYREAIKDIIKEEAKQRQKFTQLIQQASTILFKIKTVFPFQVFPTTLTIDPQKITVKFKEFFSSDEIKSIPIKNISHIHVDCGPIFANMHIVDQGIMSDETIVEIPYLKKEEAMKARRIIQGLIIAHKQNVDILKLSDGEDLTRNLEQIGRMQ